MKVNHPRCTLVADLLMDWIGHLMPHVNVCTGHLELSDCPQRVLRNLALFLRHGGHPTACRAFPKPWLRASTAAGTSIDDMDERLKELIRQVYMRCRNLAHGPLSKMRPGAVLVWGDTPTHPPQPRSDRSPPRRRMASREPRRRTASREPRRRTASRERNWSRSVLCHF